MTPEILKLKPFHLYLFLIFCTFGYTMYLLRLVQLHASWFEVGVEYVSFCIYGHNLVILLGILACFKKATKYVVAIDILIIVLCLIYGFYFTGTDMLRSFFLGVTSFSSIALAILIFIFIKLNKQSDSGNT